MSARDGGALPRVAAAAGLVAAVLTAWLLLRGGRGDALVVYCAHDSVYSEKVLREFEERTGIPVEPRFDTEGTKSLGLVQQIIRETDSPRCDVFWNNEVLGTMDLAERGLLLPYRGSGFARIPERFRDPEGRWAGFGARMRVWIVNTEKLAATEEAVRSAIAGDLSRAAIARPLYGTTLTHYTVLRDLWGAERLEAWHRDWRARGVREVQGNATVKNLVAEGVCDLGLTDTDDFFLAKDAGKPVAMLSFRLADLATERGGRGHLAGGAAQASEAISAARRRSPDRRHPQGVPASRADRRVICIPNTVAIVKGARHPDAARRLVDYLLSEEVELGLARSRSRQIPLGKVSEGDLPDDVAGLARLVESGYPLAGLGPARASVLEWLRAER